MVSPHSTMGHDNDKDDYKRKINEIKTRINNAMDKSYFIDSTKCCRPYVCLCCDRFLDVSQVKYIQAEHLKEVACFLLPQRLLPDAINSY